MSVNKYLNITGHVQTNRGCMDKKHARAFLHLRLNNVNVNVNVVGRAESEQ